MICTSTRIEIEKDGYKRIIKKLHEIKSKKFHEYEDLATMQSLLCDLSEYYLYYSEIAGLDENNYKMLKEQITYDNIEEHGVTKADKIGRRTARGEYGKYILYSKIAFGITKPMDTYQQFVHLKKNQLDHENGYKFYGSSYSNQNKGDTTS